MRSIASAALFGLILVLVPRSALAQTRPNVGDQVVLSGRVDVARGQRAGDVVVFHGPVSIGGDVQGSVVVFDGAVSVSGSVRDNVVAFNGPVSVASSARIGGDLVTRGSTTIAPGATIRGDVRRVNDRFFTGWQSKLIVKIGVWLAYSVSTLLLGLLLLLLIPRGLEAAWNIGRRAAGSSAGWGVLLFLALPLAGLLIMATVLGIPLGLGILLALWLLYMIGYTTGAWVLGRTVVKPPGRRFGAFLAGWGILRVVALVPFLAGIAWLAATVFGLGALVVAVWRARHVAEAPPPAPPPSPAAISGAG